jgi:hypothetical protein
MNMKKYLILAVAILLACATGLTLILIHVTKEKNRLANNYEIEVTGRLDELQTLTKKELKMYHSDLTKQLNDFGIKAGQVKNIVYVKYEFRDSIIRKDSLIFTYDTIAHKSIANFQISGNCFDVSGCVEDSNIYITDYSHNDSILVALYKKRTCLFKKPIYKAIAISGCSGDTLQILNNIEIKSSWKK